MNDIIKVKNMQINVGPMTNMPSELIAIAEELNQDDIEANDIREIITKIDVLAAKHPNLPDITDIKLAAYSMLFGFEEDEQIDDKKFLDDLVIENYKKFPNFLPAKCNYALYCLENKRIDEFPKIFDNKFSIEELYPDKKVFDATDVLIFYATIGEYFCVTKDFKKADECFEIIFAIDEDTPYAMYLFACMLEAFPNEPKLETYSLFNADEDEDEDFDDEDEDDFDEDEDEDEEFEDDEDEEDESDLDAKKKKFKK